MEVEANNKFRAKILFRFFVTVVVEIKELKELLFLLVHVEQRFLREVKVGICSLGDCADSGKTTCAAHLTFTQLMAKKDLPNRYLIL